MLCCASSQPGWLMMQVSAMRCAAPTTPVKCLSTHTALTSNSVYSIIHPDTQYSFSPGAPEAACRQSCTRASARTIIHPDWTSNNWTSNNQLHSQTNYSACISDLLLTWGPRGSLSRELHQGISQDQHSIVLAGGSLDALPQPGGPVFTPCSIPILSIVLFGVCSM